MVVACNLMRRAEDGETTETDQEADGEQTSEAGSAETGSSDGTDNE